MFSFLKHRRTPETNVAAAPSTSAIDPALIAVITAAIARFRDSSTSVSKDVGFVVRRVRRI
jgi:hypothetical protein